MILGGDFGKDLHGYIWTSFSPFVLFLKYSLDLSYSAWNSFKLYVLEENPLIQINFWGRRFSAVDLFKK